MRVTVSRREFLRLGAGATALAATTGSALGMQRHTP